jgi:hypothetical protein
MKKIVIGSLVAGILMFIWQFVTWGAANLHERSQQYTDKQDAIMSFLNSQNLEEGGYIMPTISRESKKEEWEAKMKEMEGKPWASIQYHKEYHGSMGMRIARSFLIDFLTMLLFCWIIRRLNFPSFTTILTASLVTGLIVFFNAWYTHFIWYETADIWAHFGDAIISWGLVGLWLGWWFTRGRDRVVAEERVTDRRTV